MLIPDYETEVDFLNCEAISATIVELLKDNRNHALTVGVHGDWGAGKSSILKMIERDLNDEKKVAVLWFNGWTFEGFDDAKTVLIESTISEICRLKSGSQKLKDVGKRLMRQVNWLKIAKHSSGYAFNILTGLPSLDQIESAKEAMQHISKDIRNIKPEEIPVMLDKVSGYLKSDKGGESIPDTIHEFRSDFQKLLDEAKIDQLVVLIDDLDRCLPETAIETLEAIRLFLFVPKTAFVIGADEGMIEYAVRRHFPDLSATPGSIPYARNYLEKLIQIPFRIPALGSQETRIYVILLLVQGIVGENHDGFKTLIEKAKQSMQKPWAESGLTHSDVQAVDENKREELNSAYILAQQIAPILADGTKGNPRQIKRFLNTLLVRQVIAKARGFENLIKQTVLAKLMLAERFQPDFYDYIAQQVMISNDGVSNDLASLERDEKTSDIQGKGKKKKKSSKKPPITDTDKNKTEIVKWLENKWLQSWFSIDPMLGDIDLRPYVFVARDKRLLSGASQSDNLSQLITSLCGSKLVISSVENEVKELSSEDASRVFNGLKEHVLSAGNFLVQPTGVDGLRIVAKYHLGLQNELINLVGSLDVQQLGAWVVKGWNDSITETLAKNKLSQLLQKWSDQDGNNTLKKMASMAIQTLNQGEH